MTPDQIAELAARLHFVKHTADWQACDEAADLIKSMAQRVLDEPVAFRDPETGDFSRVGRVGWQPLYLYPQAHGTTDRQEDAA